MKKELAKTFSPADIEDKWYQYWESNGYYKMGEDESKLDSFSILLPPPNVTGTLHMGHGFNQTLMDCLLYTSPSPRDRTRSRMPSSA